MSTPGGVTGHLLVVEDDPDEAALVQRALSRHQFIVTVVGDGAACLAEVGQDEKIMFVLRDVDARVIHWQSSKMFFGTACLSQISCQCIHVNQTSCVN
jgi:CheY-like chemotaxis protein